MSSRSLTSTSTVLCTLGLLVLAACEPRSDTPLGVPDGEAPAIQASHAAASVPVVTLPDFVPVGTSHLVRGPQGVDFQVRTTGLTPGNAYTLWVVIFNNPAGCAFGGPGVCGPDDVVNPAARPDMVWGAGNVAGGSGTLTLAGRRHEGLADASVNAPVGLPAFGLEDASAAEIHLAVHDHGPKLAEYMPDMIKTIDGGCTDAGVPVAGVPSPWNDHPGYGRRGPNTCATIQVAVHTP